jgi:hypothetical protein
VPSIDTFRGAALRQRACAGVSHENVTLKRREGANP